jgi:hypothetical protein
VIEVARAKAAIEATIFICVSFHVEGCADDSGGVQSGIERNCPDVRHGQRRASLIYIKLPTAKAQVQAAMIR